MTEREVAERVGELQRLVDRLHMPDHRFTAEMFLMARDELRTAVRRLDRDLGGRGRQRLPQPTAVLRHRERIHAAKTA